MSLDILQVSFYVDPRRRAPAQLLKDWHSLPAVAEAAARATRRVTVIQASAIEGRSERAGIEYHFIAPDRGSVLTRRGRFVALLRETEPDVIHVHGLDFARELIGLRALAPTTPILLQDHASGPPRFWRRPLWKRGAAQVQGIAFCAREQSAPFERRGLIAPRTKIFEIPESTTTFTPGERQAARAITGMHGDPAVLWVGRLIALKDPLTVLQGVAEAARALPGLQLWCCYGASPLLPEVRARIARDAALRERVHLLGCVPHAFLQELMRGADLFVLGSRREGSGYAVIESLATDLPAIVTDIPSFRVLVGAGEQAAGALWPCGDARALTRALLACMAQPAGELRARARTRFESELSAAALGRKLAAAYEELACA